MTTHRPHPFTGRWPNVDPDEYPDVEVHDFDDPRDAILYDDCERCAEHAEHLTSLDDATLAMLWTRMVADKNGDDDAYRTVAEAEAGRNLYRIGVILERLAGGVIDPWTYPLRINVPTATVDTGGT